MVEKQLNYFLYLKSITDHTIDTPNKILEHYKTFGNQKYDFKLTMFEKLNITSDVDRNYLCQLDEFAAIYYPGMAMEVVYDTLIKQPKAEFRYFCFRYLDYIRQYNIPHISKNNSKEAVLIEFRCFPHIEFLLRNSIQKLGDSWNYTVVCCHTNKVMVKHLCGAISPNIKVVVYPFKDIDINLYNILLSRKDFWEMFVGEKILIYQEDSCIFNQNIDTFLQYDYIGAPWPLHQNDNSHCVGNGGLSLRTKNVMIKVIDTIHIMDSSCNSSTLNYMNSVNLRIIPEDVYFSKNMIDFNLGNVAQHDIAKRFSIESIYCENSFGGHGFWLCDPNWKQNLYKNVVVQVNPDNHLIGSLNDYEHRGGWKYVINQLIRADFFDFSSRSDFNFIDLLEAFCWGNRQFVDNNKPIICIIHGTIQKQIGIEIDWCHLQFLLNHDNFLKVRDKMIHEFTFSDHIRKYLIDSNFFKHNTLTTLRHPLDLNIHIKFSIDKYIGNIDKCIVQLGQQQRFQDTIFQLRVPGFRKVWLPGTKVNQLKEQYSLKYADVDVEIKRIENYIQYDEFISKNIILCHVIDANANNTIIECMVREIPILVNRHPAVEEYLGQNYPFYFEDINDIPAMLNLQSIFSAHDYLKKLDKRFLSVEKFTGRIFDVVYRLKSNNI